MGQYYRGAVLKKNHKLAKQPVLFSLSPYKFTNGAKLMEHSYIGNNYVDAYMEMISDDKGLYFGYPFVWVGDYADSVRDKQYYDFAHEVEDKCFKTHESEFTKQPYYKYLINFTKKQYVKMPRFNPEIWQMHPLSLLTAYGNGRGGGDYSGAFENEIGIWAFDRIGATNCESYIDILNLKEIKVGFEPDF